MTVWEALLLGIVQGLTEFLPVSSSGHLALAQSVMRGFDQPGVVFDVALHLGTVAAVVALEWRRVLDIVRAGQGLRFACQLLAATLATVAVALPLRARAEAAFENPPVVLVGLVATALLLLVGRAARGTRDQAATGWAAVLFIGLAQGAAVMPGISRSGSTIVAGMACGLERRWAADFSFILSIPAVLGAALVEGWTHRAALAAAGGALAAPALVGAAAAALVGAAALLAVRRLVHGGKLHLFAYYLLPLALLAGAAWKAGLLR